MAANKKLKVVMAVVDGNEVSGASMQKGARPSPAVHPAIGALLEGLAKQDDLECHVVYGQSEHEQTRNRQEGSLIYSGVFYKRWPGMGGALLARRKAIQKYIEMCDPDLVHGQGTERESALVAVYSGRPNVVTLHGNFREIRKVFKAGMFSYYWLAAHLETLALKRAGGIICISNYVKEITRSFSAKKFVIPNAVEEQFLNRGGKKQKRNDPVRVCCMGTIDARKQTRLILKACEILWRQGEQFVLDVYGSAGLGQQYFQDFMAELKPWEEKKLAVYHGYTATPVEAIERSDIMVSASCEESFGMNVLEAMALGVPVVAPMLGGIKDILVPDETGLTFHEDDPVACAQQIRHLIKNSDLWSKLSQQGPVRAREKFSPVAVAERTVQAYHEIVAR